MRVPVHSGAVFKPIENLSIVGTIFSLNKWNRLKRVECGSDPFERNDNVKNLFSGLLCGELRNDHEKEVERGERLQSAWQSTHMPFRKRLSYVPDNSSEARKL